MRLPIVLLALLVSTASASPPEPASSEEPEHAGTAIEVEPAEPDTAADLPPPQTPKDKLDEAVLNYQTNKHGLAM